MPTTPTGCLVTRMRRPFTPAGTISPLARRASSANQRTYCAPMAISPFASASGLPISTVSSFRQSRLVVHQRIMQLP